MLQILVIISTIRFKYKISEAKVRNLLLYKIHHPTHISQIFFFEKIPYKYLNTGLYYCLQNSFTYESFNDTANSSDSVVTYGKILIIGICILLRVILTVNYNTFCFATIDKVFYSYLVASVLKTLTILYFSLKKYWSNPTTQNKL
jgi:hypothetical protein